MSKQANLLQESLENLEAGKPLETSLESLPVEEQASISLVSRLRAAVWPRQDPQTVKKQRGQIIALYSQEPRMEPVNRPRFSLFNDWRLPVAISAAVGVLLFCGFVTMIGSGLLWFGSQRSGSDILAKTDITKQVVPVESPDLADEPDENQEPNESLAAQSLLAPNEALLSDLYGLVETQVEETWQIVSDETILTAGTHLRTSGFSSASLTFKDGSLAQIGPNSEISIDTLVVDPTAGTREIVLMQWSGESSHNVVPLETGTSSYQVDTPSALGKVKGTQFHIRVVPEQTVWVVDDGAVEVSGVEDSVYVGAGEMTRVMMDEEPAHPVDFITGQGEVSLIGENWVIGGQSFQTHAHTIIIGNPQVGDLVFYEGHLLDDDSPVADLIVLVRRNPANTFTLTGKVQNMDDPLLWEVNGHIVALTNETDVDDGIVEGDLVRIKGIILGEGELQAEEIRLIPDENGTPFEFTGVVLEINDDVDPKNWLISDITVVVDENTVFDEGLEVTDVVHVQGWIQDDGTWLASSITRFVDQNSAFEFVGYIENMDPWQVAGISIITQTWTTIDPGLKVGDLVRVSGQIQTGGTWLAFEIRKYDEALQSVLIGRVFSIEPWVVSGMELNVDSETVIVGEIVVGMLVRVEMQLFPDGTHKVVRIEPFDGFDWELGCQYLVVTVTRVDGDQIILDGWPALPLSEETQIEGEIKPGSVIQTMICYDEDMNVVVVYILVLYEPVLPLPDDGDDDDDDDVYEDGNKKVAVCHKPNSKNPHTIVISSSALPAHLNHGDTLGPCQLP